MTTKHLPPDVQARVKALDEFLKTKDSTGRPIGTARCGIYAFFDFDGEPIYVGQTVERVSTRVRRHLTNQRTDAVAMHVLDPSEVAEIEVWPFWEHQDKGDKAHELLVKAILNDGEYAIYNKVVAESPIGAVLNEVEPPPGQPIEMPQSVRGSLIDPSLRVRVGHPDDRIARRAQTIAYLSSVTKERDVSLGLRKTLVTQAERLRRLAEARYLEVKGQATPAEVALETVGHSDDEEQSPT